MLLKTPQLEKTNYKLKRFVDINIQSLKYNLFGFVNILTQLNDGYRVSIQCQNEIIDKNIHILSSVINCI